MKKNIKVERAYEIIGDRKILICEYKYDDKGALIYMKDSDGGEYHWEYKYDNKGNIIYEKDNYGKEWFYEYEYDNKDVKKVR